MDMGVRADFTGLADAAAAGVTGSYEVLSFGVPPRSITVTGFRDETVDVIVQPNDSFEVLVVVRPRAGLGYFALRNACCLPM